MSLRRVLQDLLADPVTRAELAQNPAETLARHGFDGLDAGHVGDAIVHYADAAPLAEAEALQPVVTGLTGVIPADSDPWGELAALDGDGVWDEPAPVDEVDFGAGTVDEVDDVPTDEVADGDLVDAEAFDTGADGSPSDDADAGTGAFEPEPTDVVGDTLDEVVEDDTFDPEATDAPFAHHGEGLDSEDPEELGLDDF